MADPTTCSLCGRPAAGPTVDPGPDLGRVHRSCFIAWDRRAEAEERMEVDRLAVLPFPTRQPRQARGLVEVYCA